MPTQSKRRLIRRSTLPFPFVFLFLLLLNSQVARADEIAIWNFNDSDLIVDHGNGTITTTFNLANVLFAAGTTNNARQGDLAGQALSLQAGTSTANNGRNLTISLSTAGFANIIVSFATQGTGTGFNNNQFQYSIDGITFVDFGLPYTPASAFGTLPVIFNLSGITALNDNANAAFRIVFGGATSATGNNRIDNVVVEGTSTSTSTTVPEPATILLLGSGLTLFASQGRRRRLKGYKTL